VIQLLKKEGIEVSSAALSEILDPEAVASRNNSLGGTAPAEVKRMVKQFKEKTASWELDKKKKDDRIDSARKSTGKAIKELT
jgi:hypothetical protein